MTNIDLLKIIELNELAEPPALDDWLVVRDNSTGHTKKVTVLNALNAKTSTLRITVNADGTGDYPTIQEALDAVPTGGAEVEIAPGYYVVTASTGLVIKKAGTVLKGSGLNTQIEVSGPSVTTAVSMTTTAMEGVEIHGLYFIRTNTVGSGTCLDFSDTPLAKVDNVYIADFDLALKITDTANVSFYSHYSNIIAANCNTGVRLSGNPVNDNTFDTFRIRCRAGGAGKGLDLQNGNGNTFINMNCEPSTGAGITGIAVGASAYSNTFVGVYAENNATGVSITSGAVNTCFFGGEITSNTSDISDSGTSTQFYGIATTSGYRNKLGVITDNITLADTVNIIANTTTGTKIGTATSQKFGFYNATPVVQQNTTGTTTGFTAGAGSAVDSAATFTGNVGSTAYTIGDVVRALKNLGLLAQ